MRRQDRPLEIGSPLAAVADAARRRGVGHFRTKVGRPGLGGLIAARRRKVATSTLRGTGGRDEVARHLGNAAGALSLAHRDLDDAQPGRRGPHLHLEVPAKCLLLHTEAVEHITADRAEGRHIREAHAVAQAEQEPGEGAGNDLRRRQAALLARAEQARSEHEIRLPVQDRRENVGDHLRAVATVTVDEKDDIAGRRQRPNPRQQGPAVATTPLDDYAGSRGRRVRDRTVRGAAIDHDHLADIVPAHCGHARRDGRFLVQAGDDDGYACMIGRLSDAGRGHRLTSSSAGRSRRMSGVARPTAAPRENPGRPGHSRSPATSAAWRRRACSSGSRSARTARCSRAAPVRWR